MKERVRALIKKGNEILLIHRIKNDLEYWVFPGGGVEGFDKNKIEALVRECKEEIGIDVKVGALYAISDFRDDKNQIQSEYFYVCTILGGKIGSGTGPEFQKETHHEGVYALEWVPVAEFALKTIKPDVIRKKILQEGVK